MLESVRAQFETTRRFGATQHLAHLREERRPMPDQATLDAEADARFHGGYRMWRRDTCPTCFEARAVGARTCACSLGA
jgi:hypothetical protein